jgi:hypothetical protein
MNGNPPATERSNAFLTSLAELNEGITAADLDRQLRELVCKVRETGKKGSLTLTFNVEPRGADTVVVSADSKPKLPEDEKFKSIFYVGGAGELLREHPKQEVLPFAKTANQ